MSLTNIIKRLRDLGCTAKSDDNRIELDIGDAQVYMTVNDEWQKAINSFYKARKYSFDHNRRILTTNRSAEFMVVRLDSGYSYGVTHKFTDIKENSVMVAPASREYKLSYFESDRYEKIFRRVKERIERRANRNIITVGRRTTRVYFNFEDIFPNFHTVTYSSKQKPRGQVIEDVAIEPVKACLFALAYRKNESWELSHEIKSKGLIYPRTDEELDGDLEIPRARYNDAVVTFYKVAKSSLFPSQVFLSYYHILEFYFHRVSDELLFNAVYTQLNNPDFRSTYENVTKLLAAIKQNDKTSNEKDMLLDVLRKYVAEEEFVDFIRSTEAGYGENLFTKPKQNIFGKTYPISLDKGHALSNAATIIKHVRNALVHSSDKYTREDSFLPLSASEDDVVKYIPIVQFMAERVIFATARP